MNPPAERSISTLPEQIAALAASERATVEALFRVTSSHAELVPPQEMEAWITNTFGSVRAVRSQTVVKTLNRWTLEGTIFNDLRARRPVAHSPGAGDDAELAAGAGDPFDHPLTGTPADIFGRVEGRSTITASNVAKYDALHAVIILAEHNPLAWTRATVLDAFTTAGRWLDAAAQARPDAHYPFIMWNCRPRSGASQVHAHLQATLGVGVAYGRVELWRRAMLAYRAERRADYFADLYAAHDVLGLAGQQGKVLWLAHLTPLKEKELILLAPALGDALYGMIHDILRALVDKLGVRAYNLACYLPPRGDTGEDWSGFPVVVRIVDRGDTSSATSDIGAMELFAQPVVAADPWKVSAAMRAALPDSH